MTRYLLISFCLLLIGCGSYPKKQGFKETPLSESNFQNSYFADENTDYVYKAQIDVYNKHFGGLLIIKKIENENHRVAFTTEMGNKLFDFSFIGDAFKVNYIIDDFDKAILINILKQDFKTLIKETLVIESVYEMDSHKVLGTTLYNKNHYYFFNDDILEKITRTKGTKEKVRFQFSNISNTIVNQIEIQHYNIKLKITLKSITK